MHNDNVTTMEFVIKVLIEIFQCGRVVIIIEVSCHNNLCPTLKRINGTHMPQPYLQP